MLSRLTSGKRRIQLTALDLFGTITLKPQARPPWCSETKNQIIAKKMKSIKSELLPLLPTAARNDGSTNNISINKND